MHEHELAEHVQINTTHLTILKRKNITERANTRLHSTLCSGFEEQKEHNDT